MELPNVDPSPKNSLVTISRDESTKKKIIDIINHQFDLEIYLKQRELSTIRQEIAKAENILNDLKQAVENETMAANMPEAAHYTRRSAMYYHGGSKALLNQGNTPKRKVYRTSEKSKLYGRRQDGVYVSLACPACHRDDFANQQGFLNHCRISHNLEFGPYEQIMLKCGTPVDESEVPLDSPARTRPVMNLIPAIRQTQKKLERPSIKVFEEDVDMELENERKSNVPTAISEVKSYETPAKTKTVDTLTTLNHTSAVEKAKSSVIPTSVNNVNEKPIESSLSNTVEQTISQKSLGKENSKKPEPSTVAITTNTTTTTANNEEQSKSVQAADTQIDTNTSTNNIPKIESLAAAMSSISTADIGSRFYIKRRILVGNVSKYLAPERRDPSLKQFTHKWMIYIVEPPQSKEKISAFITCARFYLHPSYKPHDVVDVTDAPFKLTRLGWGEFPVRIQLFFVDKRRNKSVDLIHHLKLDNTQSGKQLLGSERSIEIELDRNTDFNDTTTSTPTNNIPVMKQQNQENTETSESMAVKQKMSLLGGILKECVRKLPIVRAGSHGKVLPYSCALSSKMFFKWSVGKRKALEWHRARLLRLETQKRAFEVNDNVLRIAAEALTTKDVVLWCRTKKYTPVKSDANDDTHEQETPVGYCKFCGSLRDGHDESMDDNCPRRPKGWNSRKRNGGSINSMTSVTKLLSSLEMGWDADDEMDIDVDMNHGPTPKKEQVSRQSGITKEVEGWIADTDTMDVVNERTLDWIWSVVGQLRLKSVIANDMLLAKNGNLQGPMPGFDLSAAMNQRLVVGNILTQATRVFLKKLINQTLNACRKEDEGSANKSTKMMVPYHIYQALQQREEFDFLTNQYMASEEEPTKQEDVDKMNMDVMENP
ncbi:uncharacterized protein BX663DRAFT_562767 [Cokeromyces recurvatus]|uniref:uncharacterized protein n=1 Tax=Cokeromyces recurvatus TaxID=90255 RepID=UPI00221E86A4|nr:uncharacterized protein BX663DRAFT_562767 [Cokeromyces recurvatus]KAI7901072.1 hypothetical protein BX663DRAFT_562767 [Cokeromyces recurvatus]